MKNLSWLWKYVCWLILQSFKFSLIDHYDRFEFILLSVISSRLLYEILRWKCHLEFKHRSDIIEIHFHSQRAYYHHHLISLLIKYWERLLIIWSLYYEHRTDHLLLSYIDLFHIHHEYYYLLFRWCLCLHIHQFYHQLDQFSDLDSHHQISRVSSVCWCSDDFQWQIDHVMNLHETFHIWWKECDHQEDPWDWDVYILKSLEFMMIMLFYLNHVIFIHIIISQELSHE